MNLFIFILNGFCVGISVILGQLYGTGDRSQFRKEFFVAVVFGSVLTLALSGFSMILLRHILVLIQTPAELIGYSTSYLMFILAGLPFTYFYNLLSNVLRSVGNTKAGLYFLLLAIIANIILDIVFIANLEMGTAGAAAATVIAQCLSAVCCFFYLKKFYPELICTRDDIGVHRELLSRTVQYGITSAMQASSLYIGKILVQGAVNTLGTPGIRLFIGNADLQSIQYGIDYLRVVSIFYIFCFMGSALVGYFRGIGKVHVPFWCSTSHITIRVILSYLLVSRMGLPAIGLATGIGWIWAVTYQVIMYFYYKKLAIPVR